MNHTPSDRIKMLLSRPASWNRFDEFLLSVLLLCFLAAWVFLSGSPLSLAGCLLLATYVAAGSLWTTISQFSWPSRSSCLAYYPVGFGISTGFCTIGLLVRLGLIGGALLALLLGGVVCVVAFWRNHASRCQHFEQDRRRASAGLVYSGAALLLFTTVLFASQLHSASTLTMLSGDTSLLAWNDYIAHARTTLEISSAQIGVLPQSSLGPELRLAPYHYGHYILPALLLRQGLALGSLQAYTALAPTFGAFLLLAPILDRFRLAGFARIAEVMPFSSIALLTYAIWLHLASDTFVDPVWLLVAGPGTMYAAAVMLALLQIYVTRDARLTGGYLISLVVVVTVLLLLYKVHLLHSFAIFLILLVVKAFVFGVDGRPVPPRLISLWKYPNRYFFVAAIGALLLAAMNRIFAMSRNHPAKDFAANALKFTEYFTGLTFDSYNVSGLALSVLDIAYLLFCALLGLVVMVGPLYVIAILLSRFPVLEQAQLCPKGATRRLLWALLGSLLIAVFLAPAPAWWPDSSEFQNRAWPVLWCIALWFLAGLRLPISTPISLYCVVGLQMAVLIGCFHIIPASKLMSIAAVAKSSQAYPTIIPLSEKIIANRLKTTPASLRYFAWKQPFASRENELYALTLSAVSGRLPLYALPNYQVLKGSKTIRVAWDMAASASAAVCTEQLRSGTAGGRSSVLPIVDNGRIHFSVVCP